MAGVGGKGEKKIYYNCSFVVFLFLNFIYVCFDFNFVAFRDGHGRKSAKVQNLRQPCQLKHTHEYIHRITVTVLGSRFQMFLYKFYFRLVMFLFIFKNNLY